MLCDLTFELAMSFRALTVVVVVSIDVSLNCWNVQSVVVVVVGQVLQKVQLEVVVVVNL